jgi:plastocyanin
MLTSSSRPRAAAATIVIALLAIALIVAGCGSTAEADPTPVKTFKITPAPGTSPVGSSTPAATATATAPAQGEGGEMELTGRDSKFDKTELSATAGPVTIKFLNKDGGVIHNLHVYQGNDARGASVAETDLAPGPVEQQIQFNVAAGTYYYQCDAHPTTMKGTLTVK